MKNFQSNRTRDLLVCCAVPQPAAPSRIPEIKAYRGMMKLHQVFCVLALVDVGFEHGPLGNVMLLESISDVYRIGLC